MTPSCGTTPEKDYSMRHPVNRITCTAASVAAAALMSVSARGQMYSGYILQPVSGYYTTSVDSGVVGAWFGSGATSSTSSSVAIEITSAGQALDLAPTNMTSGVLTYSSSNIYAAFGGEEGGLADAATVVPVFGTLTLPHPVIWNGSSTVVTDVTPTGYYGGSIQGMAATMQVGYALNSNLQKQAFIWSGKAATAENITPSGYTPAEVNAISGTTLVGDGTNISGEHALYWNSSLHATDINPTGYNFSTAIGVSGNLAVGYGALPAGNNQALAWNVSVAGNFTDITPTGFNTAEATAASGTTIVGYGASGAGGSTAGNTHALFWNGVGTTATDLNSLLPLDPIGGTYKDSYAYSIGPGGVIIGAADYLSGITTITNAVVWKLETPAPVAIPILASGFGLLMVSMRRRRRSS